jgi:hypothetical protein
MGLQFRDDGLEFRDDGLEFSKQNSRLWYSFFRRKRLSRKCHGKFPKFFLDFGFRPSFRSCKWFINKTYKIQSSNKIGPCRTLLAIHEGSSDGSVNVKVKKLVFDLNGGEPPEVQVETC